MFSNAYNELFGSQMLAWTLVCRSNFLWKYSTVMSTITTNRMRRLRQNTSMVLSSSYIPTFKIAKMKGSQILVLRTPSAISDALLTTSNLVSTKESLPTRKLPKTHLRCVGRSSKYLKRVYFLSCFMTSITSRPIYNPFKIKHNAFDRSGFVMFYEFLWIG